MIEKNSKMKSSRFKIIGILVIVVSILAVFIVIRVQKLSQYEYLKEVFISEAEVTDMQVVQDSSASKYLVQLELKNQNITLDEEHSWFEVNNSFYEKCHTNNRIGVLVGNFDVFKESLFGFSGSSDEVYENSVYAVVDVFDSLEAANKAYPHKSFTAEAQLMKKTTATEDEHYFVLYYDEREMSVQVDSGVYDQYKENDKVSCNFDGIGDFVKIVGIESK